MDGSGSLGRPPATGVKQHGLRERPIQYGLTALTVMLVAAPLLPILYQSVIDRPLYDQDQLFTFANFARLFQADGFGRMIWNTIALAVLTTLLAVVIGVTAAIVLGRTDIPGRRLLGELFLWPLYVSSLVLCFAWAAIYGPSGYATSAVENLLGTTPWDLYTITGMAVVAGVSLAPVTYLYCLSSVSLADPTLEEAARIAGAGRARTLFWVTLPLLRPAIFYSAMLNLTAAIEVLSIPLIFGEPAGVTVLTTFLYKNGPAALRPDHGLLATAAVLMLAIICALIWLQNRLLGNTRRFVTLGGKATRPRPFLLGWMRWPAFALMAAYVAAAVLAPLGVLVLRGFASLLSPLAPLSEVLTLDNYRALLEVPVYLRSIWNSILISGIGGAIATLLVSMIAIVVHRSTFPLRGALHYVALFPRAVPGLVAGIGFFYAAALLPGMGALRNTIWILVIAFTMRYIPAGFGAVAPMLLQVSPDLDQAARVQGANWWTTCRHIVLPLMKRSMMVCFVILFISFFKEYSTAVFLFAPGGEIIGTSLLQLWVQGLTGEVAALATVQIAIITACVAIARAAFGVKLYG